VAVTLFVGKISPTNVGRVALQVGDVYMSDWPSESAGKNDIKLGDTHDVMFPRAATLTTASSNASQPTSNST